MTRLPVNTSPAERARGASFGDLFRSQDDVEANRGTVFGTPTIDFGATLNGTTDYIRYQLQGCEFAGQSVSFKMTFYPDFAVDDGVNYYLFATTDGKRYSLAKDNIGRLILFMGNTFIAAVDATFYQDYWFVNERNVLTIYGTSGNTSIDLNGNIILNSNTTVWSPVCPPDLFIGISHVLTLPFKGKITDFQGYNSLLTSEEATDFYTHSTYNYRNQAVLDLPMRAAQHVAGDRTLDVSASGVDAVFGAGAATPTKLAKRGYQTDGGDHLQTSNIISSAGQLTFAAVLSLGTNANSQTIASYENSDGSKLGFLLQYTGGQFQFYTGLAAGGRDAKFVFQNAAGNLVTIIGCFDTVDTCIYLNGVEGTNATIPTAPDIDSDSILTIFKRSNLTFPASADTKILQSLFFNFALTPIQAADLHGKMKRAVNAV